MEGFGKHMEALKAIHAWSTSYLMNCWRSADSDPVTPGALLGLEPESRPITSAEQLKEIAAASRRRARMEDV